MPPSARTPPVKTKSGIAKKLKELVAENIWLYEGWQHVEPVRTKQNAESWPTPPRTKRNRHAEIHENQHRQSRWRLA